MKRFLQGFAAGAFLPAVVILAAMQLGFARVDAKAAPPGLEKALATRALAASLKRLAPQINNPVAPTEANLMSGMKIYSNLCAGCHGDPNGESVFGASFYPPVPQFVTHPPRRPEWELFWVVKNGVRYTSMPAWDAMFGKNGDEQIWKAVTFLSHLESLPPAVNAEWHKKPAQ